MLMQAARWLSVFCGGILLAPVASATVYELPERSTSSSLPVRADYLIHTAFNAPDGLNTTNLVGHSLTTRASESALMRDISQSGHSLPGAAAFSEVADLQAMQIHSYGVRYMGNLRHYGLSTAETSKNDVVIAPASAPGIWAMLLIGAGLVGFHFRRKSKVRGIRIAPS